MQPEEALKKLSAENDLLRIQLADANEMLELREEEILILRQKSRKVVELQSTIENNLEEFSYMQHVIGKQLVKAEGASRREQAMETELLEGIRIEKEYYNIKDKFNSTNVALLDVKSQLNEVSELYKNLKDAQRTISELESRLDILNEEKELLEYELRKARKQLEAFKQDLRS